MHYENICNKLVLGIVFKKNSRHIYHQLYRIVFVVIFFLKTKPIGKVIIIYWAKVKTRHYNFICDKVLDKKYWLKLDVS